MSRHRKGKHGDSKLGPLDPAKLEAIRAKYNIGEVPVVLGSMEPITAYDGIATREGFACHLCVYVSGTELSIVEHYKKAHGPGEPKSHIPCSYQQLCGKDTHKSKFRVHPKTVPEPVTSLEAMMSSLRKEVTLMEKPSESTVNARAINPWLLASGFHLHIETFDVKELTALVAGGLDAKTTKLRKVVRKYYFRATDLLPLTNELVKQMLLSPDPPKR